MENQKREHEKNMPEDGHTTKRGQENSDHDGENQTDLTDVTSEEKEPQKTDVQAMEPMMESLTYMGMDSTAVTDIVIVEPDIPKRSSKSIEAWIGKVDNPDGRELAKQKVIEAGIKLAEQLVHDANRLINFAAKSYAERAIIIGQICLRLKELIKGSKTLWGAWAEKNLPFLNKRNRQKFMMLAERADCHKYAYLGVDRMEMLCSVTKGSKNEDPIGALLNEYSIEFDESSEMNMGDFKSKIDAAIGSERLKKHSLQLDFETVTTAINAGVSIDKATIKRLNDAKDSGGNPETLLKRLAVSQGKDDSEDAEKRLQDFNTLSSRLIKTIDYIIKIEDQKDKVDRKVFKDLIQKLMELQKAASLTFEKE